MCSSRGAVSSVRPALVTAVSAVASDLHQLRVSGAVPSLAKPNVCPSGASSCSTGLRLARAGPMWTLRCSSVPSTPRRYASIASGPAGDPQPVAQQHGRRAGAQRRDHRVALELGHPGLRLGVAAHGGGGQARVGGRYEQPGPAGMRHHQVLGRVRRLVVAVHAGIQHREHLAEVLRAQSLVVGRQRGRRRLHRTHLSETPWLRQIAAYARNVRASGVTSALYQSIARERG